MTVRSNVFLGKPQSSSVRALKRIALILALATFLLAQQVYLVPQWTSPPQQAVPVDVAVSERGVVLATSLVNGGGYAIMFNNVGQVLSSLYYAQGVGDAAYKGNTFAFVTLSGNVIVEADNGTIIRSIPISPKEAFAITMSPDGKEFVVCHGICSAYTINGKKLWTFKGVRAVTNNPAWLGELVFIPDASGKLIALNAKDGKLVYELNYGKPVYAVAACSDLLAVGVDDSVYVYSISKAKPILLGVAELGAPVNDIAFGPQCDVMLVASGNYVYTLNRNAKVSGKAFMGGLVQALAWNGDYVAIYKINGAGIAQVQLFKASVAFSMPKTRYQLNFTKINALEALPLTYPGEDGTIFLLVRNLEGKLQIWTMNGTKVIGKYDLPTNERVIFVPDVRTGEVAKLGKSLLVQIGNKLYAVYGNNAKLLKEVNAKYAFFIKVRNEIYAVKADVERLGNYTEIKCSYSNGLSFAFKIPKNATFAILPDALDAKGCLVAWTVRMRPVVYYEYQGTNGKASGKIDLTNAMAGFGLIYLEKAPGQSEPYVVITRATGHRQVVLELNDALTEQKLNVTLPLTFTVVGAGDYLGEGYIGDFAVFAINGTRGSLVILNTRNAVKRIDLGKIGNTVAVVKGLAYHKGYWKSVFGVGSFTSNLVDVRTNIGTFKFALNNVVIVPSTLNVLLHLGKTKLCYTAIVNQPQAVYYSSACLKR